MREKSGRNFEHSLDTSIVLMLKILRQTIDKKTMDLTSRSIVEECDSNALENIQFVSLCISTAQTEFEKTIQK